MYTKLRSARFGRTGCSILKRAESETPRSQFPAASCWPHEGTVHPQLPRNVTVFTGKTRQRCVEPILREAWSQGYPVTAICVQRFDDSLCCAIRITYRISLRSSSLREPRYPLLRVV